MFKISLLKKIITSVFFILAALVSFQILHISQINQQTKLDYAELGNIRYGLFNVNQWKEQIALIVFDEITKLNLSNSNQKMLKKHVEIQVAGLINKVESKIKESNKGSLKGWMKQSFLENFINMDEVREGIPVYADAIITQMTTAKTEHDVKDILKNRIQTYFNKTFEHQDNSKVTLILEKTNTADIDIAKDLLDQQIKKNQRHLNQLCFLLMTLLISLFLIFGFQKSRPIKFEYTLMLSSLLVLLTVGVIIPMIDIEAKITEMSFILLDHPISFKNQVLYFQSKSILDVFWLMITNDELQMKAVGLLIVTFSILFPLVKLLSSLVYYTNWRGLREHKYIQFFVLKSGKWSMADVMIVAIFMAYIGFNGVIGSQLQNLISTDPEVVAITTNGTSLQPGFYVFFTYVALSLLFSQLISRTENKIKLEID